MYDDLQKLPSSRNPGDESGNEGVFRALLHSVTLEIQYGDQQCTAAAGALEIRL